MEFLTVPFTAMNEVHGHMDGQSQGDGGKISELDSSRLKTNR